MSTHLTRIVEAFNAGRLDEVVAHTPADYHYSDPFFGRVDGAAAHQALMREILDRFPDRKIEVLKVLDGGGCGVCRVPLDRYPRRRR